MTMVGGRCLGTITRPPGQRRKEEEMTARQKLKLQEELIKEQKFKEREFAKKEIDNNQDSEVTTSALENFKIDKTSQN